MKWASRAAYPPASSPSGPWAMTIYGLDSDHSGYHFGTDDFTTINAKFDKTYRVTTAFKGGVGEIVTAPLLNCELGALAPGEGGYELTYIKATYTPDFSKVTKFGYVEVFCEISLNIRSFDITGGSKFKLSVQPNFLVNRDTVKVYEYSYDVYASNRVYKCGISVKGDFEVGDDDPNVEMYCSWLDKSGVAPLTGYFYHTLEIVTDYLTMSAKPLYPPRLSHDDSVTEELSGWDLVSAAELCLLDDSE